MGDAGATGGMLSPPSPPPPELSMLARAVQRLVARNDALDGGEGTGSGMAAFEGAGAPRIGLAQYLERVHRYAGLEPECYVVAYAYIDRAAHRRPAAAVASRNVHRLLLACLLVASKVLDDFHHDNAFFARVGGVSNAEMNKLELELLDVLGFEVMLSRRLYDLYHAHLHDKDDTRHSSRDAAGVDELVEAVVSIKIEERSADGDDDEDNRSRLANGAVQYDWNQGPAAGSGGAGVRRHSSSQAPARYSFSGQTSD
ncbi:hypothetical protein QYE76_046439 [Lolium multiflorum]|uniref:Cyclin n=1 Tax=Lolium multiflorum TaxID=4521 RepID=A0AAD8X0P3_LOLMU|nr:hypothetical protein QYE76_046439 [Lolium multiflorum]